MDFSQGEESVMMPENFSMVEDGFYRSSFPRTRNIAFLKQLELKMVISLVLEDYPDALAEFYSKAGIKLVTHGFEGNKGPFKGIDIGEFHACLADVLNPKNRPLLVHCNKGKHRTGCVVACVRRIRSWALSSCIHEYLLFSCPKSRLEDQRFIEGFDPSSIVLVGDADVTRVDNQDITTREAADPSVK